MNKVFKGCFLDMRMNLASACETHINTRGCTPAADPCDSINDITPEVVLIRKKMNPFIERGNVADDDAAL